MDNSYTISEVATKLSIATKTLRRWEESGKFSSSRTLGNQRRYNREDLQILDAIKHNIISAQSDLLTLPAAASLCAVSPTTIERWVREGKIHPFITSGKTYYPRERLITKLDELSKQISQTPESDPPWADTPTTELTAHTDTPTRRHADTPSLEHSKPGISAIITKLSPILNTLITLLIILIYHTLTSSPTSPPIAPTAPTELTESTKPTESTPPTSFTSLSLLPAPPPDPIPGTLYYDASSQSLRLFTNTWTDISSPVEPSSQVELSFSDTTLISGTRIMKKDTSSTLINHKSLTPSTPVSITFNSDYSPGKKYWLEQDQGSFTLHTDYPVGQNSSFTYLILAPSLEESDLATSSPTLF